MTTAGAQPLMRRLARWRVPLGFLTAAAALVLAQPTAASLWWGLAVAAPGEALRIWAAGHIDKGREITTSGPYRLTRHPLYLGSSILGVGFAVAANSPGVAAIVAGYLGATLLAAMRTEEAALDVQFKGEYSRYREGDLPIARRRFRWSQALANREHRAVVGLVVCGALLYARTVWPWGG